MVVSAKLQISIQPECRKRQHFQPECRKRHVLAGLVQPERGKRHLIPAFIQPERRNRHHCQCTDTGVICFTTIHKQLDHNFGQFAIIFINIIMLKETNIDLVTNRGLINQES